MSIKLRSATIEDAEQIFVWRNDPWIVSLSTSQQTVSWEEHVRWLTKVLNRNKHLLFIIESDMSVGMGSVRFDLENDVRAVVTIYLLHPFVGRGIGVVALSKAYNLAFEQWSLLRTIHAFIRNDNLRSIKAFSKVGFQPIQPQNAQHSNQVEMVLDRQTVECQSRL